MIANLLAVWTSLRSTVVFGAANGAGGGGCLSGGWGPVCLFSCACVAYMYMCYVFCFSLFFLKN